MTAVADRGITLNLDNNEAEKLIKIFIHHPKLNESTPGERSSQEVNGLSELSNRVEKLEDGLENTCRITRSFIKHSEKNFRQVPKMVKAERRNREISFSLLNDRITNSQVFIMDKFTELGDIMKSVSRNNVKSVEKPQTKNGGPYEVKGSVMEDKETSTSPTNLSGSGSTKRESDNSFNPSDDNAVEEGCDDNLNNTASDSINDEDNTF